MSKESVVVARYVEPPLRTNNFDSPVWNAAEPAIIKLLWSGEPAAPERHAEARLCWSNNGLHVRFVGNQHEPLVTAPKPDTTNKTLGLWDRDVCEIFIAPDPENPSIYYEFEAAPTGEWVDLAIAITPSGRDRKSVV